MLTRVQCPCGFVASAQSIRAASYGIEQHVTFTSEPRREQGTPLSVRWPNSGRRLVPASTLCVMGQAKLLDRQP